MSILAQMFRSAARRGAIEWHDGHPCRTPGFLCLPNSMISKFFVANFVFAEEDHTEVLVRAKKKVQALVSQTPPA